jgi:tetratricopeptide (TPR) repeat protein
MDMVPPDTVHTWAREQFSRMMRTAPNLSSAHTALALLYSQGGYAVDAEHHYLQAIKNDSTYVDAHTGLGKLYTDTGRFDEAAPVYEKVLALSVTAENRPRVYLNLGVSYMGAGRRTDAIYAWRKALEMAPDYAEAYMNLGIAYQQDGHPDSARSVWTQALNIKPDFIAPRVALARLYSAENRLDEALRYYREVLDAGARDPTLFAELGLVYERLERFQEAIINYEEASRLDPEDTDLQTALKAVQNKLTEQEEARKASKIRIRQIVVRVKAEAERILADLKNGADFVEMARSRSIDPSAARGGDLGYFGPGEMIPAFEEATRVMKVGDISGVVETPIGYHIIKRVE